MTSKQKYNRTVHGLRYVIAAFAVMVITSIVLIGTASETGKNVESGDFIQNAIIKVESGDSIQDAIDKANPNDTIIVDPGTYAGFTVDKDVDVHGAQYNIDPEGALYRGGSDDSEESVITGTIQLKADGATINGFKLTSSYIAAGYTQANDITISYNILDGVLAKWGAIHLHGEDTTNVHQFNGAYISYNTIINAQGHGIWTLGYDDVIIEHNHVLDATKVAIKSLNHVESGMIIRNNVISNPGEMGINYRGEADVVIKGNSISGTTHEAIYTDIKATIEGNKIVDCNYVGIHLAKGADESIVSDNVIFNTANVGIQAFAPAVITDNEISGCYMGIQIRDSAAGTTIDGNYIYDNTYEGIEAFAPAVITDNEFSGCYHGIQIRDSAAGTIIDGNNIHDNQYRGLSIKSGVTATLVTNNQFANNQDCGVSVRGDGDGSGIHINNNEITGNRIYGVESERTNSNVDATRNLWGHSSGPSEEGRGRGDAVSTNVDYKPWLSGKQINLQHGR